MKDRKRARRANSGETTIVSLDIGSTSIKTLMGIVEPNGTLTYLSGGEFPSAGVHEGMVNAPERAQAALALALDKLEAACQTRILSAFVGVASPHVRSQSAHGEIKIPDETQEISLHDVKLAIAEARNHIVRDDRSDVLHVIPSAYSIDGVSGIPNPMGMVGFELSVDTCVVTAPLTVTRNLVRLLNATETELDGLIAAPLAAAESVREAGAIGLPLAVVDIGAQTTGFTLYAENAVWQCDSLPVGGDTITRSMAHKLRLPIEVAETLKRQHSACIPGAIEDDELIEMEPISGLDELLPAKLLAECAASGAQELASALLPSLQRAQRQRLRPAMLLLTGGGAELKGLDTLLASQLRIPVVVAHPAGVLGAPPEVTRPAFAVATGLLLMGARRRLSAAPRSRATSASLLSELRRMFGAHGHNTGHPLRR